MTTERQRAANRANAAKSTGPKTRAGKTRSSQNAYRHGLSARLARDKTPEQFAKRVQDILDSLPNQLDVTDVAAVASAQIDLERARSVGTRLLKQMLDEASTPMFDNSIFSQLRTADRYLTSAQLKRKRALKALASRADE
jgi:type II secretory pathway component HofQ